MNNIHTPVSKPYLYTSVTDPDPELFSHLDPDPVKNAIRIHKEQNIDHNHQQIIPKLSVRRFFLSVI